MSSAGNAPQVASEEAPRGSADVVVDLEAFEEAPRGSAEPAPVDGAAPRGSAEPAPVDGDALRGSAEPPCPEGMRRQNAFVDGWLARATAEPIQPTEEGNHIEVPVEVLQRMRAQALENQALRRQVSLGAASTVASNTPNTLAELDAADAIPMAPRGSSITTHHVPDMCCSISKVTCWRCGNEVDKVKARHKYKGTDKWQCNVCNTRLTQLGRLHGTWPPKEFESLDDETKTNFYARIGKTHGSLAMCKVTKDFLSNYSKKERVFHDGGEFLPLSVWSTRGFDVENIRSKSAPQDIAQHPVLGAVYRVAIVSVGTERRDGQEFKEKIVAKRDRSASEASSRSRDRKAKKRAKKTEVEKKAADKATQLAIKQVANKNAAKVKFAQKIIQKLELPISDIETNHAQALMQYVPVPIANKAKAALQGLKDILKSAELVNERPTDNEFLVEDFKIITAKLATAKKFDASITTLLASLERVEGE